VPTRSTLPACLFLFPLDPRIECSPPYPLGSRSGVASSGSERPAPGTGPCCGSRRVPFRRFCNWHWAERGCAVHGAVGVILGSCPPPGSAALTWRHLRVLRLRRPLGFLLAAGIGLWAVAIAAFPWFRLCVTRTHPVSSRAEAGCATAAPNCFAFGSAPKCGPWLSYRWRFRHFWSISSTAYQICPAPEGRAHTSVQLNEAFFLSPPACLLELAPACSGYASVRSSSDAPKGRNRAEQLALCARKSRPNGQQSLSRS